MVHAMSPWTDWGLVVGSCIIDVDCPPVKIFDQLDCWSGFDYNNNTQWHIESWFEWIPLATLLMDSVSAGAAIIGYLLISIDNLQLAVAVALWGYLHTLCWLLHLQSTQ